MTVLRILITGINGNIGTILHDALKEKYEIYGMDLEGEFSERVMQADIAEYQQIAQVLRPLSPLDVIIHLAGNPSMEASWDEVLHANIIGTRNVFEAAREFRVRRVVFASTNHVTGAYYGFGEDQYGQEAPRKLSPQDPINPDSDYGVSKAFGEAVARYYSSRWGIEAICLRIGSVREDDQPTQEGESRIWLSHRDLVQLVEKSLTADVRFGIYYGVSNNKDALWDISNARAELGYEPVDDGSTR